MHKLVADAEHIIEGNRGRYAMESELVEAPPSNESNRIIQPGECIGSRSPYSGVWLTHSIPFT